MSGHRSWRQTKQERAESSEWERLLKVTSKMSVFDLIEHMDAAGSGMAKATQDYRKDGDDNTPLLEIRRGLMELEAVTEELILRWEAAHDEN